MFHTLRLKAEGRPVSLLVPGTLLPVPDKYLDIMAGYKHVVIAEENYHGLYSKLLFGAKAPENIYNVNTIGRMISPDEIIEEVNKHGN